MGVEHFLPRPLGDTNDAVPLSPQHLVHKKEQPLGTLELEADLWDEADIDHPRGQAGLHPNAPTLLSHQLHNADPEGVAGGFHLLMKQQGEDTGTHKIAESRYAYLIGIYRFYYESCIQVRLVSHVRLSASERFISSSVSPLRPPEPSVPPRWRSQTQRSWKGRKV